MAKGKKCTKCGHYMFAIKEIYDEQYKLTIVTYECRNNSCKHIIEVKEWD